MTVREAIEHLKDMYNSDKPFMHGRRIEIEVAISALEKQIPKKPITNDDNWFCCRNCGETFSLVNTLHKRNKYCGECGTAIDWGDCE